MREVSVKRDTELILANASPLKPKLKMASRSSRSAILLVACRANARLNSSFGMPQPLSRMRIKFAPPFSISIWILFAPASRLFSTNSFTTDAGRSTTSPAAIWLASCGERILIGIYFSLNLIFCPLRALPSFNFGFSFKIWLTEILYSRDTA